MSIPLPQIPEADSSVAAVLAHLHEQGMPCPRSLYLHIPFCFHKCHYCDFYSLVDSRDRQESFVERLGQEIRALGSLAGKTPLQTIFVGGGTPTLLRPPLWKRLLGVLHETFALELEECEFSVECNPETASAELFAILVQGGVNRLSIGCQSFDPTHLATLERWHDPASVGRAIELARGAGLTRLSLDLIFAIPGQTLGQWEADLRRALDFGLTHLSCYCLTYEPHTAMTSRLGRGEFVPCDPDLEADMYECTVELCAQAGLMRYEISNFALPGHECQHNLAYWRQEPWLAAGPSASAHLLDAAGGSWRWKNTPNLGTYLAQRGGDGGLPPVVDLEAPDRARLVAEQLMTGLRLREGVDWAMALAGLTDQTQRDRLKTIARGFEQQEQLRIVEHRWILTPRGLLLADAITREFLSVL